MAVTITADQIIEGDVVRIDAKDHPGQITAKRNTYWLQGMRMIRLSAPAWRKHDIDFIECHPSRKITLLYRDKAARETTGIYPARGVVTT